MNLPQQEHCHSDSTGYKPHSFVRQYTPGLMKRETVIINMLIIINVLYSIYFLLTFIIFTAHDLAPSIVETDSKAGAARFNIAASSCIPVDTSNTGSCSSAGEAAGSHFHLEREEKMESVNKSLIKQKTNDYKGFIKMSLRCCRCFEYCF